MTKTIFLSGLLLLSFASAQRQVEPKAALVIQTDFGLKDGAVSAMKGVAFGVDRDLKVFDLTHEIPAYNIWEAAYRLHQTATYWPKGTVFVSVVDPGVGTNRLSVVLKTKTGHYFVSPDNGTLTLVAEHLGIEEVRQIDEKVNRLAGSEKSYTFHGRDVYSYTGARLASGAISFEKIGKILPKKVETITYQRAVVENSILKGNIPVLDIQYGNVWTNINDTMLTKAGIRLGDKVCFKIYEKGNLKYENKAPYVPSFGDVPEGQPLVYLNSLLEVSFALNMDSLAEKSHISSGADWSVEVKQCN